MNKVLLFLLVLCGATPVLGQNLLTVTRDSIVSEVLQETRSYQIKLPPSYEAYSTSKRYPVVVVLDGDHLFDITSSTIDFLSKTGKIPESIVVGVSNTRRTRDFTPTHTKTNYEGILDEGLSESGGAAQFLDFLEQELFESLKEKYRLNDYFLLIGHSFGGLFGGYALTENSMIDAYILIDPSLWWDDEVLVHKLSPDLGRGGKRIYLTSADNFDYSQDMERMRDGQRQFYQHLREQGVSEEAIAFHIYEDENHGTVPLRSIVDGINFIFDGYFVKGMKYQSAEELVTHFNRFEDRMQHDFPALEGMINWLASRKMASEEYLEATEMLLMNAKNYPDSWKANYNLGLSYEKQGDEEQARKYYQRALELNPDNENILLKIKGDE